MRRRNRHGKSGSYLVLRKIESSTGTVIRLVRRIVVLHVMLHMRTFTRSWLTTVKR